MQNLKDPSGCKVLCTAPGMSRQSLGPRNWGMQGSSPLSTALIYTLKEGFNSKQKSYGWSIHLKTRILEATKTYVTSVLKDLKPTLSRQNRNTFIQAWKTRKGDSSNRHSSACSTDKNTEIQKLNDQPEYMIYSAG